MFANEPLLELRRAPVRDALDAALERLDAAGPVEVPIWVDGRPRSGAPFDSVDPGRPSRVVAVAQGASDADVDDAVAGAQRALADWGRRPASARAVVLQEAAAWMRARRETLAALMVREVAKPWAEADGDVAEAIDFLEYYAEHAVRLSEPRELVTVPGERNTMTYVPRGVCAVVAPWNFALAIPTGMTAGALAMGNPVVLKPAEQAPACSWMLAQALRAAGLPDGALQLLPGDGEVGRRLVAHPGVATIAFTGSGAVGQQILRTAAEIAPGQRVLKRVVCELGGKNVVLVDADADLDEVVAATLTSAYAFAGQKCSAASRLLVHERVADTLTERLAGAVAALEVGQAAAWGTDVGPLVEADAARRLAGALEQARADGEVLASAPSIPGEGHFAVPALVGGLPPDHPILRDELFGPLLAVEPVASMQDACDVVDGLPFALTGGLFSRNPATVAAVAARTPVGNLYVNREITGARVGRHPFGGNRLSGNGTKAGGPDYLLHFAEPRVVVESTVRHGLVV